MNLQDQITCLEEQLRALKAKSEPSERPTMIEIPGRTYSVSETPITVAQYRLFCAEAEQQMPNQPEPHQDDNPIVNVSWYDAIAYCKWLTKKEGNPHRLPLEDEFEYFCADHTKSNEEIAVYDQPAIRPVKTKEPNKFGLYDILGCAWEWQQSYFDNTHSTHVVRGGSWSDFRGYVRAGDRYWKYPDDRDFNVGFRVLSTPQKEVRP